MRCPFCGYPDSQVKDSRPGEDLASIRRRRQCPNCNGRFTTYEYIQSKDLIVVKKNDVRVPFQREKLFRSILLATGKRGIDTEKINTIVEDIINQLEQTNETEIQSARIGELVLEHLLKTDKIAYLRYASVYKNFGSMEDFNEFATSLIKDK